MAKNKVVKPKAGPPAQNYLDIAEIRDDCVVLKDGTLRGVIMVSSINFALKSVDEQQAIIQSYMQFLNGLEYPIQIVIQSRKMNIDAYIASLEEQEKKIENRLLADQIRDYKGFVKELVELGEIMQKRFYVIVSYDPVTDKRRNFWSKLTNAISPVTAIRLSNKQFNERREQLQQRLSLILNGIVGMGLNGVILDTQSLIELYYTIYNPDSYANQPLAAVSDLKLEEGI